MITTVTGRFVTREPQPVVEPRRPITPTFLVSDFSQIELRIASLYLGGSIQVDEWRCPKCDGADPDCTECNGAGVVPVYEEDGDDQDTDNE